MLQLESLSKKFNKIFAVKDVSFEVKPGEVVGYLGPNGAGKSTTVKMLTGLLKPSNGKILFNGRDISENLLDYKKRIGYVPENSDIYLHLSGVEYLMFVGRLREIDDRVLETKVMDLLRLFRFSTGMYNSISTYSKGMKQKILIIASMLHNPDIYYFDEPLSGLDVNTVLIFKELIKVLSERGKIILYSSHLLEIVEKLCERILIIHQGKICADDTVSNLKKLKKSSSLEHVFNNMVVAEDSTSIASDIVQVLGV